LKLEENDDEADTKLAISIIQIENASKEKKIKIRRKTNKKMLH
jgi:hypothetical protein